MPPSTSCLQADHPILSISLDKGYRARHHASVDVFEGGTVFQLIIFYVLIVIGIVEVSLICRPSHQLAGWM